MNLEASRSQKSFALINVAVVPAFLLFAAYETSRVSLPVALLLIGGVIALVFSYGTVVATRIKLVADDCLECKSLLGNKTVPISQIRTIDMRSGNRGFISIRAPGQYVCLFRNTPGAIAAIGELARKNPSIELKT